MISLNGFTVTPTMFPDKTSQIWKLDFHSFCLYDEPVEITWVFENEGELIHLAQLKDLLEAHKFKVSRLNIPFLPYARQDKEVSNTTTFALRTFAKLLNSLNFSEVVVTDCHSSEALKLINNVTNVIPFRTIEHIIDIEQIDIICYPDTGAAARYGSLITGDRVILSKKRDPESGEIKGLNFCKITDLDLLVNKKVLIVDDICDGGRTFVEAADLLYRNGASEVHLYTTHGIYSKGLQPLIDANIKSVYNHKGEIILLKRRKNEQM